MKVLSCIILPVLLVFCACKGPIKSPTASLPGKKLLPYYDLYPYGEVTDTLLPGGVYIKNMVNADTTDATLYIKYGKPGFERIFEEEDVVPATNCRTLEFVYSTPHTLGLMYECMNGRALALLPLREADSPRYVFPLYMSVEDSLILAEEKPNGEDKPSILVAADLDFNQKKSFSLHYSPPCTDLLACFDTIYFRKKLVMRYLGGDGKTDPVEREQAETLDWKK